MFHSIRPLQEQIKLPLRKSVSALLLLAGMFSGEALAQTWVEQAILLETKLGERLHLTKNFGPEVPAWNCLDVGLAEAMPTMRMIVPNDDTGDPDRVRHMLRLGKDLFVDCVADAGGQIQTDYDAGTLVGIEFRLWTANPVPQPAVTDTLGYRGGIYRTVGSTTEFLGWVYCYDAPQFAARLGVIAAFMGGNPLAQEKVWLGDLACATDTGPLSLKVQGARNEVFGDVASQGTMRLLGTDNQVTDIIRWAASFVPGGSGNTYGSDEQDATPMSTRSPRNNETHYLNLAIAAGQSFFGDIIIEDDGSGGAQVNGVSVSGVIHATGVIYVEGDGGIDAALTMVAQEGVQFYGNGCDLVPAVDDMLVWVPGISNPTATEHNNARFEGRFNNLTGSVYSGLGDVEIMTLGSTLYGRYSGSRVKVGGANNFISDGTK